MLFNVQRRCASNYFLIFLNFNFSKFKKKKPTEVSKSIQKLKESKNIQFVEWVPTGFKCGFNSEKPLSISSSQHAKTERSVTLLANTTSLSQIFSTMNHKFDLMYAKRAFVVCFLIFF